MEIMPPDINRSSDRYTCDGGSIRISLAQLKGMSSGALESIMVGGRELPCALAVIDFNSYELRPVLSVNILPLPARTDRGFLQVDRLMCASVEGLFAAGDVTGMPASVAKAIGEGVVAGFSAYSYVYRLKFHRTPPPFAYVPQDGSLDTYPGDLPASFAGMSPVILGKTEHVKASLDAAVGQSYGAALDMLARGDLEGFLALFDDRNEGLDAMNKLVRRKLVTFHREENHESS